jgi:Lrp/AsnC family transcriptional regulator, leucine-responsive regulatory protein
MGLDKIDLKILYELDLNSRQSFNQLGKKVRLRKETVFQRVKRLQQKGIIEKFQTILNVHKFGYQNYRLFLKFKNVDEESEKKIIAFFVNSKLTGWVMKVQGNWDLGVWFLVKDIFKLKNEYNSFKERFSNYIYDEKLSLFSNVHYYSRSFLVEKPNDFELNIEVPSKTEKLQDKEILLLQLLAKNSRISILDLSKELNLSSKTIVKKIKEFEKRKILLGYRLKLNLEKIGIEYYKVHFKLNNLDTKSIESIKQFIFHNPNIVYWDETISGYDLELDVQVKDREELESLINQLKKEFQRNIEKFEILNYEKEYKQIFLIPS